MCAIDKLKEYKNNSDTINQKLREGCENPDIIDDLFSDRDVPPTLYRFLANQYIKFDGDIFCDPAYLSCTDNVDNFICKVPTDHLACLAIELESPTSCIYVKDLLTDYDDEGEFILPRNIKLRLIKEKSKDYNNIEEFDMFLDQVNSYTGSDELYYARGIKTISLYTLINAK